MHRESFKLWAVFVFALTATLIFQSVRSVSAQNSVWQPLVLRLVADEGYDAAFIESLFADNAIQFSPDIMAHKMNVLLATKLREKKSGVSSEPHVLSRYLNPILIARAYVFYVDHAEDFVVIEKKYGVPGDILTALLLVETKLGTLIGKHNAVTILASMALARDFGLIRDYIRPQQLSSEMQAWLEKRTQQKANWGYRELKSLLAYAKAAGVAPQTIASSMYGAIGLCQFIPSSALSYGIDGSGDMRVDLFNVLDSLHSMANFLKKNGWKEGLTDHEKKQVIYRYNHSYSYSLTILAIANKLQKTDQFFRN